MQTQIGYGEIAIRLVYINSIKIMDEEIIRILNETKNGETAC